MASADGAVEFWDTAAVVWLDRAGPLLYPEDRPGTDPPASPGPIVWNLMSSLRTLLDDLEPGTTAALLLSGPGRGPISTIDLVWSKSLTDMAARFAVPLEPIFRANDESLALVGASELPGGKLEPSAKRGSHSERF